MDELLEIIVYVIAYEYDIINLLECKKVAAWRYI